MLCAARKLNRCNGKLLRNNTVGGATLRVAWRSMLRSSPKEGRLDMNRVDPRLVRDKKAAVKSLGDVACTGCGASLQSDDFTKMGYMSDERIQLCAKFEHSRETPFPPYVCHRCHTLRTSSDGVHIEMKEQEYRLVMTKRISQRNCLILWLVDISDFPASLHAGMADIIGPDNPVVLVGTKVDLLGSVDMGVARTAVRASMLEGWKSSGLGQKCQLAAMHMISASTGFGVASLIADIGSQWRSRGDIFVVGSANAGKSTLFNRLLPLMCGMSASGRGGATVAKWPGTTLRMIRLPILSFSQQGRLKKKVAEEIMLRAKREDAPAHGKNNAYNVLADGESLVTKGANRFDKWRDDLLPETTGVCHYTHRDVEDIFNPKPGTKAQYSTDEEFRQVKKFNTDSKQDADALGDEVQSRYGALLNERALSSQAKARDVAGGGIVCSSFSQLASGSGDSPAETGVAMETLMVDRMEALDEDYENASDGGTYLYDTPGLLHSDQTINLLDPEEVHHVISTKAIKPLILYLRPGQSIFIGGMGRLDYLDGEHMVYFSVFASQLMPINLCDTHSADSFYRRFKGTQSMAVPLGGPDRLRNFPELDSKEIFVHGRGREQSCRDVVLSNAGWVSITAPEDMRVVLRAHTPGGAGIATRLPLAPYTVRLRGKRLLGNPAAFNGTVGLTRKFKAIDSYDRNWKKRFISRTRGLKGEGR